MRLSSPDLPCLGDKFVDFDVISQGVQVGKLVDAPVYRTANEWGAVHVSDTNVIPLTEYAVSYFESGGPESSMGSSTTPRWGDVIGQGGGGWGPPDGYVNITDYLACYEAFTGQPGAPEFYRIDAWPCETNHVVDIVDCSLILEAFTGDPYPCDTPGDRDDDEVCNGVDNCPDHENTDQLDTDGDGVGDACDVCPLDNPNDPDGDGVCEAVDNCPADGAPHDDTYNPDQADGDGDGVGDVCDNCPLVDNSDQENSDADTLGDDCDNCPTVDNEDQANTDGDSLGDACDVCPLNPTKTTSTGACGCNETDIDLDLDGIVDCLDTVVGEGPRYVGVRAFNDAGAAAAGLIALRIVSPDIPCFSRYIDFDVVVSGYQVGKLVAAPVYRTAAAWGAVHVTGADIAPYTRYEIAYHALGQPAITIGTSRTPRWGDVVGSYSNFEWQPPNGIVNIIDASAIINAMNGVPNSPQFYRIDMLGQNMGCTPDKLADMNDVNAAIDAFTGDPFPCPINDGDSDNDGVCDLDDECPGFNDNVDPDSDGVPTGCDNCPNTYNPSQADSDHDGIGDACEKKIGGGIEGAQGYE